MAGANCRMSVIYCALVCLSPVGATPIKIPEFQKDNAIVEAVRWSSLTQVQELSITLEIENWEKARSELSASSFQPAAEHSTVIPEPQSLILLGIGLAAFAALMKKKP